MARLMFSCFLLGGLLPEPEPTDYCATSYCAAGLTNVGCNPPPLTGGPNCDGKDAVVVEIGPGEIDYLLNSFNVLRASYASGEQSPTFPTASRMPTLQWDEELATQAGHNARSCNVGRDQCHNTAAFSNSGQNFVSSDYGTDWNTNGILSELMREITSESASYASQRSFTSFSSANDDGHLANVINDRSSKVGCALQKWDSEVEYIDYGYTSVRYYLVCNFSDNLVDGEPLYTEGATGSECTSSVSSTYLGLCAA